MDRAVPAQSAHLHTTKNIKIAVTIDSSGKVLTLHYLLLTLGSEISKLSGVIKGYDRQGVLLVIISQSSLVSIGMSCYADKLTIPGKIHFKLLRKI